MGRPIIHKEITVSQTDNFNEYHRQYQKIHRIKHPRKAIKKDAHDRNKRAEYMKKYLKKYLKTYKRDPIKVKARNKLNNAVKAGKLIRPKKCDVCHSEGNIQAHHEDYDKALEVSWLCSKCHGIESRTVTNNITASQTLHHTP